jgi:hypothetical protein
MDIKKSFEQFTSLPQGINNLAGLYKLDLGFAHVAQVLEKLYIELGFNQEGFFPAFRVKVSGDTIEVLNLTEHDDIVKLLINHNYIQDRYDKKIIKLGSRISSERKSIKIPHSVVFSNYEIEISYQIVKYKLLKEEPIKDKILPLLINKEAQLLTYELVKQYYIKSNLPIIKFDLAGQAITKVYQNLYYLWLNKTAASSLDKAA